MLTIQTPSYDRFCLFEMERKSKDFRGMDDNVAYKNKQIDNVEISNEGRRALREKLREVKPKVEELSRLNHYIAINNRQMQETLLTALKRNNSNSGCMVTMLILVGIALLNLL